jgi:hypothetical protein
MCDKSDEFGISGYPKLENTQYKHESLKYYH